MNPGMVDHPLGQPIPAGNGPLAHSDSWAAAMCRSPGILSPAHLKKLKICFPSSEKNANHPDMNWTEQTAGQVLILKLSGDIDLQHSPKLRHLLQSKIAEKVQLLLLDFAEVRYIDSSGLATLVEYYKNSRAFSGQLAVASLSDRVHSIFELVRLSEIFGVYPTVAEAEKALLAQS